MKSAWLEILEMIPIRGLLAAAGLAPRRAFLGFGAAISPVLGVIPENRRTVRANLDLAFGAGRWDPRLESAIYRNFALTVFETIKLFHETPEDVQKSTEFVNRESVHKALARGKGLIIVMGHIGNWENMGAATAHHVPSFTIVRPLDNRRLDDLVEGNRRRFGLGIVPRDRAMTVGLRELRRGKLLAFIMDQNQAADGVFVPFFGKIASTVKGPALFARLTGAPVIAGYSERLAPGRHRIIFTDELPVVRTRDRDRDVYDNTRLFTSTIESFIRKVPDQWLWMHPRWRKRPPEEERAIES